MTGKDQSFEPSWQPVVVHGTIVAACILAECAGDAVLADANRSGNEQVLFSADPQSPSTCLVKKAR